MKINEALKQVVAGESPESVLEKAITNANYDQRLAVNSPTTVQRGNVTVNPEGFAESKSRVIYDKDEKSWYIVDDRGTYIHGPYSSKEEAQRELRKLGEDHGETFDCPADYGVYPMAGARMWPRGSHESHPQKGEPPYFKSEQLVARVVAGATPGQVLESSSWNVGDTLAGRYK